MIQNRPLAYQMHLTNIFFFGIQDFFKIMTCKLAYQINYYYFQVRRI